MSRFVAALLLAVASVAVSAPPAPAVQAASCASLDYIDQMQQADAALASGAGAQVALQHVQAAESIDPRSSGSLDAVVQDLEAAPADVDDARFRLDAIAGTLMLPPGSTCSADSNARDALRRVYSSGAFADLDQSTQPSLLEQIARAIAQFFSGLGGNLGLGWGLLVGALALVIVVALILWRFRVATAGRVAAANAEPREQSNDPDEEWSQAVSSAVRGDYRQAIRRAFRSALLDVTRRGHIRVDAAWTTRELLTSATTDADLLALLAPAAAGFDRAWYSGSGVEAADWEVMKSRCEAIRHLVTRRRPEPVA